MVPTETSLENARQLKTLRWVVLAVSVLFVAVLWNGYFNLLVNRGLLLATAVGLLLALIAWGLGKFIGSSDGGIKGHAPLFLFMLILSAVGVFNSLMINLEARKIFHEAIDSAQERFRGLAPIATDVLADDPAVMKKRERIHSLRQALENEIANKINCGTGPAAYSISLEIQKELPGFTLLTGQPNCEQAIERGREYMKQIDDLETKYLETIGFTARANERAGITDAANVAVQELHQLATDIDNGASVLTEARPSLEEIATNYQTHALALQSRLTPQGKSIPTTLDLSSVRNLGEWSQVINLIVSRLDKLQTYVYLFLAGFLDWLLVYLFTLLRNLRRGIQREKVPLTTVANPL